MKTRRCLACGQALPSWVRIDKLTCTGACRTRLCRQRKDARDTFVTGRTAVAARSGVGSSNEAVRHQNDLHGGLRQAGQLGLWSATEPRSEADASVSPEDGFFGRAGNAPWDRGPR